MSASFGDSCDPEHLEREMLNLRGGGGVLSWRKAGGSYFENLRLIRDSYFGESADNDLCYSIPCFESNSLVSGIWDSLIRFAHFRMFLTP